MSAVTCYTSTGLVTAESFNCSGAALNECKFDESGRGRLWPTAVFNENKQLPGQNTKFHAFKGAAPEHVSKYS